MKLSVSNIAWEPAELREHLALLRELGCAGVDLAPNIIWKEPVTSSRAERSEFRRLVEDQGLKVAGFHALLYTRPDLQLFSDAAGRVKIVEYLCRLADLCGDLGGTALVFGSPKNRRLLGFSREDALKLAADSFRKAAEAAARAGVALCIEPLPPAETDFIRTSDEGWELVQRVDHPAFGLHLDAKAMVEAKEDMAAALAKHGGRARHFHVGDPGLTPPGSTGLDHAPIGRALRRSGYDGYVAIEMRRGAGPSAEVIRKSVDYVRRCYFAEQAA